MKLRPYFALEWERLFAAEPEHSVPGRSGAPHRVFDRDTMPCKKLSTPQQNNCTDCGCFLLSYIEARACAAAAAATRADTRCCLLPRLCSIF